MDLNRKQYNTIIYSLDRTLKDYQHRLKTADEIIPDSDWKDKITSIWKKEMEEIEILINHIRDHYNIIDIFFDSANNDAHQVKELIENSLGDIHVFR